jgi:hypothetical protein
MTKKINSGFALLDVKSGRKGLAKEVKKRKIPVVIKGFIVSEWGHDDGVSIEFEVEVKEVKIK